MTDREADGMTVAKIRKAFPNTHSETINSDLRRLKADGVLSNEHITSYVWQWRATA